MVASSERGTGILVPLYVYPGSAWDSLTKLAAANPNLPITAVVNPANGPGARSDPFYALAIISLRSAGIEVLGYVATGYGSITPNLVEALMKRYRSWYPLDGIFFDEMSTGPGTAKYYSALTSLAKSMGFEKSVGNPGTWVSGESARAVDLSVIYEGRGFPALSLLGQQYPTNEHAFIAYGVKKLDHEALMTAARHVSYLFVTDGEQPNPYRSLPPYLGELVALLQSRPIPRP